LRFLESSLDDAQVRRQPDGNDDSEGLAVGEVNELGGLQVWSFREIPRIFGRKTRNYVGSGGART
jgi:hypothetical protein